MTSVPEIRVCKKYIKPTSSSTKLKCAKIIQKWDTAHTEISASLHMGKKSFTKPGLSQRKHIELKNANLFGKKVHVVMVSDVSSFIMNIKHAQIVTSSIKLRFFWVQCSLLVKVNFHVFWNRKLTEKLITLLIIYSFFIAI